MITIKEDTTLVGISELRTHMDKVLKEMKKRKILLQNRNKPVAVIMSIDKYNQVNGMPKIPVFCFEISCYLHINP